MINFFTVWFEIHWWKNSLTNLNKNFALIKKVYSKFLHKIVFPLSQVAGQDGGISVDRSNALISISCNFMTRIKSKNQNIIIGLKNLSQILSLSVPAFKDNKVDKKFYRHFPFENIFFSQIFFIDFYLLCLSKTILYLLYIRTVMWFRI